jgi:hypothetical protein
MFGLAGHYDKRTFLKINLLERPACRNSVAISVRMLVTRSSTFFIIGG